MLRLRFGNAGLRLPGLDLLSGGSRRDAQGRGRILAVGSFRDLCAYDLGWRDTPGAHSLRLVRKGRHSLRHSVTVEMSLRVELVRPRNHVSSLVFSSNRLEFLRQSLKFFVGTFLNANHFIAGGLDGTDDFVQFKMNGAGVAVL
jgi:hypothetical protein